MSPGRGLRLTLLLAATLAACQTTGGIEGRWAEPGQCDADRWRFADGVVYRTTPGTVRQPFHEGPGEVSVIWGRYKLREDGSVLLTRPAPDGRDVVLLWLPQQDGDGNPAGWSMEVLDPGGQHRRFPAEPCPGPNTLP